MYEYAVSEVVNVHDGDSITARIDLGCYVSIIRHVRLAGINAPELNTDEGGLARDALVDMLAPSSGPLTIHTVLDRSEKYGRLLGTLFMGRELVNVNDEMVRSGHAVAYDGHGPRGVLK